MDFIKHITENDFAENFITIDDILSTLKAHINKKESIGLLDNVRNKLLIAARQLLKNTVKLNKIADRPDFEQKMQELTGKKKLRGYWASKFMSVPLLKSCIDQLEKADSGPALALAISRITGMVENAEIPVETPYEPRVQGGEENYHHIYKYLTKLANWNPEKIKEVDQEMAIFRDRLVRREIEKIAAGGRLKLQRPHGW